MKGIAKIEVIALYPTYAKARTRKTKEEKKGGKCFIKKGEKCYNVIQYWEEPKKQTERN